MMAAVEVIIRFVASATASSTVTGLRQKMYERVNKFAIADFASFSTESLITRTTNDMQNVHLAWLTFLKTAFLAPVVMVWSVILLLQYASTSLTIVTAVWLVILIVAVVVLLAMLTPKYKVVQKLTDMLNVASRENLTGVRVVRAFNAESQKVEEFREKNDLFGSILYRSQAIGTLIEPAMQFVSYLTYAAVLIVAGLLFANGAISDIGVITGFIVYVSLFQEPLAQIGQASSTIQLGTAACNRVFTFLEQEELPDEGNKKQLLDHSHIRGEVEFKDVCFGYDPKKLTITNFSGKIKPGMKVAIIGPTGAGKTTLVNLLMRFYEITSGDILVDGVSIKDMSRQELRDIFGMILQETWVINGTLRENIVYNLKNVDENRLQEILEETNLSHYVATLPDGLDTEIQKESALSAGQKQLVTIARAMTENAPMLILDEATSNVDTRTEILIQKAMDSLTSGRTSFVIAHRLSTIKNADLIFVMKDGNIVETGNHDSLMELGGLYSEIYNSQFN